MTRRETEREQLTAAVARAQRRVTANRALWETALAATIALLGPTLFLALGKNLFAWPLFAAFAVGGAGIAWWRLRRRRPDLYQVSQVLDARLRTEDQISTAIYFLESQEPAVVRQRRAAAKLAEHIDLEAAFPLTLPRSLYGLASVFLMASTFCALRYFLEKPLRMDVSLPQVVLEALLGKERLAQGRRNPMEPEREPAPKQAKALAIENQAPSEHGALQQGRETSDPAASESPQAGEKGRKPGNDKDSRAEGDATRSGEEPGDPMASDFENDAIQSYEEMLERDAKSGLQKSESKQGKESSGNQGENRAGSENSSNSLLAKLREAMNNMLSRLQQKSPGAGQQQGASRAPSDGQEQSGGAGEGQDGAGQPKAGGQEAADAEGAGSESQDVSAQNAAGKSGGKSSDQGSRGSTGDGAGKQEGDKQIAETQQQEAMGKLSELYGRRAANVAGEVTVEAQAGKQTLRTPQSQKQARHSDSGGEVSRDEIPLAYQAYVKEYFNKLRQNPEVKPANTNKAGPSDDP